MTTIVGLQGDNFAVVYVDSRISSSDSGGYISQISTLKEGCGKVAVNGKYLLGAAGDVRAINILHHVFQPPTPPPNMRGKRLDQFFTAKFIPALRECFEQQGYAIPDIKEDKEHMAEQASTILVVIHGIIYVVDGDYSWTSDSSGMYFHRTILTPDRIKFYMNISFFYDIEITKSYHEVMDCDIYEVRAIKDTDKKVILAPDGTLQEVIE